MALKNSRLLLRTLFGGIPNISKICSRWLMSISNCSTSPSSLSVSDHLAGACASFPASSVSLAEPQQPLSESLAAELSRSPESSSSLQGCSTSSNSGSNSILLLTISYAVHATDHMSVRRVYGRSSRMLSRAR